MELTPPPALTRSPSSPANTYCPSERSIDYPSPGIVEQQYKISPMYGDQSCAVTPPMDPETSLPPLDSMGHPDWNTTPELHPVSSASGMPSILSGDYDSFGSYPYSQDVYHAQPASQSSSIQQPSTPPPTGSAPRSPASVPRTTAPYTPPSSVPAPLTPRVKMEAPPESGQSAEGSQYPSPRSVQTSSFHSDSGPYTSSSTSSTYFSDHASTMWPKPEYHQPVEPEHFYPGPPLPPPTTTAAAAAAAAATFLHDARRQYRVARPRRTTRRLTTKEEANFQCEVKGCGKLFSRSYNFKAHMETHDEKREYPFPCQVPDCSKRFVRKTDLQRHHQSVHLKERTHKCDYCGRMFARKDTLRRHMEDGCSKRFDITTLDLRAAEAAAAAAAAAYESMHPGARPPIAHPHPHPHHSMSHHHHHHQQQHHMIPPPPPTPPTTTGGGLPPMAVPPLCGSSVLGAGHLPPAMRPREPIASTGDHSQGQGSWAR